MTHVTVTDAARQIRQEEAARARLYQRLSPLVGAFDHSEMSAAEIAAHGLRKLGLKVPADDRARIEAANSYLAGRDQAAAVRSGAMDARPGGSFVDAYIAGR